MFRAPRCAQTSVVKLLLLLAQCTTQALSESRRSGVRAARFALLTLTLRPRIRLKGDVRGQPLEGRGGADSEQTKPVKLVAAGSRAPELDALTIDLSLVLLCSAECARQAASKTE